MANKRTVKPFDTNGYAKTVTSKSGEPKSKAHLQIIKDTLGKPNNKGNKK